MHFKKFLDESIVLLIVHMYVNSVKWSEVLLAPLTFFQSFYEQFLSTLLLLQVKQLK